MKNFRIPELGENIKSATIVKILVSIGDVIELDQAVLELETDKATIEVPSDIAGKVLSILVNEGGSVGIGQDVLTIGDVASGTNFDTRACC